jgi:hypothetical protein
MEGRSGRFPADAPDPRPGIAYCAIFPLPDESAAGIAFYAKTIFGQSENNLQEIPTRSF